MAAAAANAGNYWVIAVPNSAASGKASSSAKTDREREQEMQLTQREIMMKTAKFADYKTFEVPKLRVGTLDTLMALSDELGKADTAVEAATKKILKTFKENKNNEALSVDGAPPEEFIEKFQWNQAKFPVNAPLAQLAQRIQQDAAACDEDLRKKTTKLTELGQLIQALERKESGTLLVKPLGPLIDPKDIKEGEFLTTVVLVIPKMREQQFLQTYETIEDIAEKERKAEEAKRLEGKEGKEAKEPVRKHEEERPRALLTEDEESLAEEAKAKLLALREKAATRAAAVHNVVPRSAKFLNGDSEFAVYRVVVFKKGLESFKNLCRQERWTVRPYVHDPEAAQSEKEQKAELMAQQGKLKSELILWCETQYTDMFAGWIHLKVIRLFVESVLRFGIPVNFQVAVLKPKKGQRLKLRKTLNDTFAHLAGHDLFAGGDEQASGDMAGLQGAGEFYPYVYLSIALDEAQDVE